ncbi:MAG: hypothetical protein HY754_01575 [Nitrospirae bacterium]|nr:hypothetical protein [Nitrospirota bacterium]
MAIALIILALFLNKGLIFGEKFFSYDTLVSYGGYHYFVKCLIGGEIPYWNFYSITGMPFYPVVSHIGLLDPLIIPGLILHWAKVLSITNSYVLFIFLRCVVFVIGLYFLLYEISRCKFSSLFASGVMLCAFFPSFYRQAWSLYVVLLTPLSMLLILKMSNGNATRRTVILSILSLALFAGISVNIYIPSFYFFNVLIFCFSLVLFGMVKPMEVMNKIIRDKKILFSLFGGFVCFVMISWPAIALILNDGGKGSEIFPSSRVLSCIKSGGFKKIIASDLEVSMLSGNLANNKATFVTKANIVNVLFPDLLKSIPSLEYEIADVYVYIGILSLIIIIYGIAKSNSQYKKLAVFCALVMFVNIYNPIWSQQYNVIQKAFNFIFPPLGMIRSRNAEMAFFMLYIAILLALGMKEVYHSQKDKINNPLIYISGFLILLTKLVIAYYYESVYIVSRYDLLVLLSLAVIMGITVIFKRINPHLLTWTLILMIFFDLGFYNLMYQDSNFKYVLLYDKKPSFEYYDADYPSYLKNVPLYREPFSFPQYFKPFTFQEYLQQEFGALSRVVEHTVITTKRYYDLITHAPTQNLFVLTGITDPIVKFYPVESVVKATKRDIFNILTTPNPSVAEKLFIETENNQIAPGSNTAIADLDSYETTYDLEPQYIWQYYMMNRADIERRRAESIRFIKSDIHEISDIAMTNNSFSLKITADNDGYVYLNDSWSKHWKAFDGNKELPIKIANYNYKSVFLEKGRHIVKFSYEPAHVKHAYFFYILGIVLIVSVISIIFIQDILLKIMRYPRYR